MPNLDKEVTVSLKYFGSNPVINVIKQYIIIDISSVPLIKSSTMRYIREISEQLTNLALQFPALILTGARQTGKTTLLKELFPTYSYVTLDLPSLAEIAEYDPEQFLKQNPPPVVIDEAQYAPKLFRHLKYAIDQNRELKGQYILTGSQKFNLMKEVSDSLAGRCVWLELEGLSWYEINSKLPLTENILDSIGMLITRGSLPELWKEPSIDAFEYYRTYLATYLERDVRQILNISSLRDFERFIRVCATRNAQLINKTDIAKDVGVSLNTVNQWLSILEASNQITLLEPYFGNTGKRVIKSPKLYFNELGMLGFLLGINTENFTLSPSLGNLWEGLIYSELRKLQKNKYRQSYLWFYRDNRLREIDFIIENNNQLHFIEVKWTTHPSSKDTKNLNSVYDDLKKNSKNLPYKLGKKIILSRLPHSMIKDDIIYTNLKDMREYLALE